jgi:hypothetical protein
MRSFTLALIFSARTYLAAKLASKVVGGKDWADHSTLTEMKPPQKAIEIDSVRPPRQTYSLVRKTHTCMASKNLHVEKVIEKCIIVQCRINRGMQKTKPTGKLFSHHICIHLAWLVMLFLHEG